MTIKSNLINVGTGKSLWSPGGIYAPILGSITQAGVFGRFKTASRTTTGTTTIVIPPSNESLIITDLIITAEKKNSGTDTLRLYDGTNAVNIVVGSVDDSPLNLAIGFQGCWQGWRDAYIQLVQAGANHYANIAVGYYFVPPELSHEYADWNHLRDVR